MAAPQWLRAIRGLECQLFAVRALFFGLFFFSKQSPIPARDCPLVFSFSPGSLGLMAKAQKASHDLHAIDDARSHASFAHWQHPAGNAPGRASSALRRPLFEARGQQKSGNVLCGPHVYDVYIVLRSRPLYAYSQRSLGALRSGPEAAPAPYSGHIRRLQSWLAPAPQTPPKFDVPYASSASILYVSPPFPAPLPRAKPAAVITATVLR
jgi:hypothetical protein